MKINHLLGAQVEANFLARSFKVDTGKCQKEGQKNISIIFLVCRMAPGSLKYQALPNEDAHLAKINGQDECIGTLIHKQRKSQSSEVTTKVMASHRFCLITHNVN